MRISETAPAMSRIDERLERRLTVWLAIYVLVVFVVTFLLFAVVKRNPWFWHKS